MINNVIIEDGQATPGYILGGRYYSDSKEGLIIWGMGATFAGSWEVYTDPERTSI